jgi:hypothetical protein
VKWNLNKVLIYISFMARDGKHVFFFFFCHSDFFLRKTSTHFIYPFLHWVVEFWKFSFLSSLYILLLIPCQVCSWPRFSLILYAASSI